MLIFQVDELGMVAAVSTSRPRNRGLQRPAGECVRGGLDVLLRVVADSHGEEFQQLTPVVLVRLVLEILVVVQPEDHGGIFGELEEQRADVRHPQPAEHIDLRLRRRVVGGLGLPRREDVVPEQGHLLFQLSPRVEHPGPPNGAVPGVAGAVEALDHVDLHVGKPFGVQQVLHDVLVGTGREHFQFIESRAESGAAHQVGVQVEVGGRSCHDSSLLRDIRVFLVFYQSARIVQGMMYKSARIVQGGDSNFQIRDENFSLSVGGEGRISSVLDQYVALPLVPNLHPRCPPKFLS